MQGHRKFAMTAATAFGGLAGGQETLQFVWNQIARIALYYGLPLETMSDARAANVFGIVMLVVFYWMREANAPMPSAPGSRVFDDETLKQAEQEP